MLWVQGERNRWKPYPVAWCLIVGLPVKAAQPLLKLRWKLDHVLEAWPWSVWMPAQRSHQCGL